MGKRTEEEIAQLCAHADADDLTERQTVCRQGLRGIRLSEAFEVDTILSYLLSTCTYLRPAVAPGDSISLASGYASPGFS